VNNKFVFVTPVFNCQDKIAQTLMTMMSQSYNDWRAIIINDMSTDKTLRTIKKTIANCTFKDKFTIVDNKEKMGEVRNTLNASSMIDDDEIVVRLDGGDWLTENDTLWLLNQTYQDSKVDVAWTSHRWEYTTQNISAPLVLSHGQTVYDHPWVSSHLKTFRNSALKKVPIANFKDENGNFIMIACDQAVFLPMMHMSIMENRLVGHIPVICYHYSINLKDKELFTSERSIKQKNSAEWIRSRGFIKC